MTAEKGRPVTVHRAADTIAVAEETRIKTQALLTILSSKMTALKKQHHNLQ